MKKIITFLFFAAQATYSLSQSCNPLDQSFGNMGKATGAHDNAYTIPGRNIIVQPDNKIIQIHSYGTQFGVIRYNSNGSPDNTFGSNGRVTTIIGQSGYPAYAILQTTDGKIVVAGYTYNGSDNDIAVVRYNSNGSIDNTFGQDGKVITSIGTKDDYVYGLTLQPDGKIVVVGSTDGDCFNNPDCYDNYFCKPLFTVVRYNTNGSLDNGFGTGGKIITNLGPLNAGRASSVALQTDGKIVVAGESLYDLACDDYYGYTYFTSSFFSMVRYNSNGEKDASFGTDGKVADSLNMLNCSAIALQGDGKIVALGAARQGGSIIERYNSDGSPDNSFGQDGKVFITGWLNSLALLPDGKIALAGGGYYNGQNNFFVYRLESNGSFDNSFNNTGKLYFHPGPSNSSYDYATAIALQGDKLVVGGRSAYDYWYDILVVRLTTSVSGLLVSVTPSDAVFPCQGESAILSVNQTGSYQWYKDGVAIGNATASSYNATADGSYSVKVTNGSDCGQSEPVRIIYNGLPVTITPSSSLNICQGQSVDLTSNESGTLQWFKNNILIPGAIGTVYTASTEGEYKVFVKNSKGCGQSSPVYLHVNSLNPFINWNGSALYTFGGYYQYQWYLNDNPIAGANNSYFQPTEIGSYKVVVSDYGCNNTSDVFILDCNAAAVPKPVISWNGIQLSTVSGYASYQWYLNDTEIPGVDTNVFRPTAIGTYKVKITNIINCSNTSDAFILDCNLSGPSKPPINWNSSEFSTTPGYAHYQWLLNNTVIAGADNNTYKPVQNGSYKVIVIDNNGCQNTSDNFNLIVLAVSDIILDDSKLRYYPNPAQTTLYIDISNASLNKLKAEIYDQLGRLVLTRLLNQTHNQISLQYFPSGIYQLVINNNRKRVAIKLVVTR